MRDIFNSYTVTELRKFATEYNKSVKIAGASKMKKDELVDALVKHQSFFKDVKMKNTKMAEKKEEPKMVSDVKKVKKIRMKVKGKEPVEKKENVKVNPPVFKATPEVTIKDVVDAFDKNLRAREFSQWNPRNFDRLENFLMSLKPSQGIDIDEFMATGDFLPPDMIKQLIMKYGVRKSVEYVKQLLMDMTDGKVRTRISPEALTNKAKNKTVMRWLRKQMKMVKL